jgi:hypothetical protein
MPVLFVRKQSADPVNWKWIALTAYLLVTTLVLFFFFSHWGNDDAFITYRYAANLEQGLGFVYNPGQPILSTSTPLFTLLLALFGKLWPNLPALANLLGAFSLALGGVMIWDMAQTWKTPLVGWCGLLLYPTFPLLVSTLGSETLLALAFCLGTFACYARGKYSMAAVCAALAVLSRPDGILVAAILVVHFLVIRKCPIPWGSAGLLVAICAPWVVYAWVTFGSPLPVTLDVKQHQGLMTISQRFLPGLMTIFTPYLRWSYLLEVILAFTGIVYLIRHARQWVILPAWTLLYLIAYSALGVSRYFWYYAPLVPGLIILVGLGITYLRKFYTSVNAIPFQILAIALFALLFSAQGMGVQDLVKHPDERLLLYQAVGEWLQENTPQDSRVESLEIGVIGYYAQREMVDFAGLIHPEVADQFSEQTTYDDAALWTVAHFPPDFLVLQPGVLPRFEQEFVVQNCQSVQVFLGQEYGSESNLNIFSCK